MYPTNSNGCVSGLQVAGSSATGRISRPFVKLGGNKMSIKSLFAASAMALAALTAPAAHGSLTFQGVTFTFTQTGSNQLTFELAGTLGGDWSTANYLGAFDLKGLGLDF